MHEVIHIKIFLKRNYSKKEKGIQKNIKCIKLDKNE
jgi:hypothetical protein